MPFRLSFLAILLGSSAAPVLAQSRGFAYVVDEEETDHLFAVDLTSGAATDLGAVGFGGVEALAFHPDGRLFGIDEDSQQVLHLDLRTGEGNAVSVLSVGVEDPGFAIDALGRAWVSSEGSGEGSPTLFALTLETGAQEAVLELPADFHGLAALGATLYATGSDDDAFFRIDTQRRQLVRVGDLVDPVGGQPSLDFASDGQLWMIDDGGGVHRLDPVTGAATEVATTITGCDAMAIPLRQVCAYSVRSDGDGQLYRIDLLTGTAIAIGATGFPSLEGLAFHPDGRLFGVDDQQQQLVTIDLRTGAATLVGALGLNSLNPGFAIDDNGVGWIVNDNPTNSLMRVELTTGAATTVGNVGRDCNGLAAIGTSLFAIGDVGVVPQADLLSVNSTTGAGTVIGPLLNDTLDEGGLDATPDGVLWGLDDLGSIAVLSAATGEVVVIAQTINGCEGLAIPPGCGADELSLQVTSASFDLDWTLLLEGGDPSLGSFQMKGVLSRAALPADLSTLQITVRTRGGAIFSELSLDEKGAFRSGTSSGKLDPKKGALSFTARDLNIGNLLELENADHAGTILVPLDVQILQGSTVVVAASALLPFAFESELNLDASGSFAPKLAPSYTGAAIASSVSAKQGDGDAFDLKLKATLLPDGAGFLLAAERAAEGSEAVVTLRVGGAAPLEVPLEALQITGEGTKAKWKLIGIVPGLKSLSYSAAKGSLSVSFEDLAGTGFPLAVTDAGPALEHLLEIEVLVATAGLPQRFQMFHLLKRSTPESTTWK
ncbi:MAG: hypothetical protein IPN34_12780 [Planctomycetes bacterium]|nr:hypothetical protein [Planctomycetota bacterium]